MLSQEQFIDVGFRVSGNYSELHVRGRGLNHAEARSGFEYRPEFRPLIHLEHLDRRISGWGTGVEERQLPSSALQSIIFTNILEDERKVLELQIPTLRIKNLVFSDGFKREENDLKQNGISITKCSLL